MLVLAAKDRTPDSGCGVVPAVVPFSRFFPHLTITFSARVPRLRSDCVFVGLEGTKGGMIFHEFSTQPERERHDALV